MDNGSNISKYDSYDGLRTACMNAANAATLITIVLDNSKIIYDPYYNAKKGCKAVAIKLNFKGITVTDEVLRSLAPDRIPKEIVTEEFNATVENLKDNESKRLKDSAEADKKVDMANVFFDLLNVHLTTIVASGGLDKHSGGSGEVIHALSLLLEVPESVIKCATAPSKGITEYRGKIIEDEPAGNDQTAQLVQGSIQHSYPWFEDWIMGNAQEADPNQHPRTMTMAYNSALSLVISEIMARKRLVLPKEGLKISHRKKDRPTYLIDVENFRDNRPTPTWDAMLRRMPEPMRIDFMVWFAKVFDGGDTDKRALWLVSEGGSGTTTLVNVLVEMFSSLVVRCPYSEKNMNAHSTSALTSSRLMFLPEMSLRRFLEIRDIKSIVGGDPIEINIKNGSIYTYQAKLKLLVFSNCTPIIRLENEAEKARALVITMRKITEQIGSRKAMDVMKEEFWSFLRKCRNAEWVMCNGSMPPAIDDSTYSLCSREGQKLSKYMDNFITEYCICSMSTTIKKFIENNVLVTGEDGDSFTLAKFLKELRSHYKTTIGEVLTFGAGTLELKKAKEELQVYVTNNGLKSLGAGRKISKALLKEDDVSSENEETSIIEDVYVFPTEEPSLSEEFLKMDFPVTWMADSLDI
jgi:hypothetical protein